MDIGHAVIPSVAIAMAIVTWWTLLAYIAQAVIPAVAIAMAMVTLLDDIAQAA